MPHMMTAERLGMKKGREEGIHEFFLSQVDARFGAVPEEIQRRIRNMKDTERLKQIARTLFQVQSLEELRRAMD